MISEERIQEAVRLLREAASPVKIILFGSYARGDISEDSDLDFLDDNVTRVHLCNSSSPESFKAPSKIWKSTRKIIGFGSGRC